MAQSLAQIYLHVVFSTKHRKRYLQDGPLRSNTHSYLAGICKNLQCPAIIVGGTEDHAHILCRQSKNLSVADLVQNLKRDSSKYVKEQPTGSSAFHWQKGYAAFSVSPSHVEPLIGYIREQEEHHRRESFQDEFRRLLKKYGIEFDERYVWD